MKFTQKNLIKQFLSSLNGQWVKAYELRGKETPIGFLGHQADRRARELVNEGELEHRIINGFAEYRVAPKFPPKVIFHHNRVEIIEYRPKVESQSKLF